MPKSNGSTILKSLSQAIIDGDMDESSKLTKQALGEGVAALDILRGGMIAGMEVVGKKMQTGECYIPEVLMSSRAMREASALLKPLLGGKNAPRPVGRVVMGTVKDDLHEIGKNLTIMMLEGAGFQVTDLGFDVPTEKFVSVVREEKPDILAMSALLSITIPNMKEVIEALKKAGLRQSVKVIVGGAMVSQSYANEMGADGYSVDAPGAVDLAKKLVRER